MAELIFYGASDDLVEFGGVISDEFGAYDARPWRGRLTGPGGDSLILTAEFDRPGTQAEWTLGVENSGTWPSWPICFTERPDREGDPAIIIDVPEGTKIVEVI